MTAVAVNCLPTEPVWKIVSGLHGDVELDITKAVALGLNNFPSRMTPRDRPGIFSLLYFGGDVFVDFLGSGVIGDFRRVA